jgi:hypothetical protein
MPISRHYKIDHVTIQAMPDAYINAAALATKGGRFVVSRIGTKVLR